MEITQLFKLKLLNSYLILSLFCPLLSFAFSETEIDSLESSGKKVFSSSSLRTALSFSLQRNLEVNSRLVNLIDTKQEASLLDLSNLYYSFGLTLNYSLAKVTKDINYTFLNSMELFFQSSFVSPFSGYKNNLKDYNALDYIQFALGDLIVGFTVPSYQKDNFLSYLTFSVIALPLSRFSKDAGLSTTVSGTFSSLYFLKKQKTWSFALSSNHNLSYSQYSKLTADVKGWTYNVPLDTSHSGSLIYRQNLNKFLPASTRLSLTHYLGLNTNSTRIQDLTVSASSSWKLKDRLYLNFSIWWKDRIFIHNPYDDKIRKKEDIRLNWVHTFVTLGGSYSF